LLTGTRVFLFGYRPRSIVGSGYSRSISAGGSWRPYLLVFRVWLIRSLTPPKTELPATIANRRPKVEKYRGKVCFYTNFDFCLRVPDEIEIPNLIPGSSNQETNAPVTIPRPKPVSKKRKRTGTSEELIKKILLREN
jgi:hypothetical protein